jgi:alcohol dehydrogenase
MQSFVLQVPSTVVFGQDVLPQLGPIAARLGNRAMIVSESVLQEGHYVERVADILKRAGVEVMVYDELMPSTPSVVVDEIASLAKASKTQLIVGLGGMRVLSIARCVASVAVDRLRVWDFLEGKKITQTLPYIDVPSSYRNHLLMRNECVVRDSSDKRALIVPVPHGTIRAAVVDTTLTQTLSSKYAIAAILDTLLAAIEGYLSSSASMYSDTILLKAIGALYKAAMTALKNPHDGRFRSRASEAGLLASMGLAITGQGMGGALSYAINAQFHLPKSWIATILLPHVVEVLSVRDVEKMARVAASIGENVEGIIAADDAPRAARGIRRLLSHVDLPVRFRDLDVTLDELSSAAEAASEYAMNANVPGGISSSDLQQLIAEAF